MFAPETENQEPILIKLLDSQALYCTVFKEKYEGLRKKS